MQFKIHGNLPQTVDLLIDQNEAVLTENIGPAWVRGEFIPQADPRGSKGSNKKGIVNLTAHVCSSTRCLVVFTPETPAQIVERTLLEGEGFFCQKGVFLCAEGTIGLSSYFQKKLPGNFFGNEGFTLQSITGTGTVFFALGGEMREYELRNENDAIKIDPAFLGFFTAGMRFELIGDTIPQLVIFGPGRIGLQTMPAPLLANALSQYKR